jgi:hypothetical protein
MADGRRMFAKGYCTLWAIALMLASGCESGVDEPIVCTADVPTAIEIQLIDGLNGQILHAPANITATVRETGQNPFVTSAPATASIAGAINGFGGTYDLVIGKAGYSSRSVTVVVPAQPGDCNRPVRQFVQILLSPT